MNVRSIQSKYLEVNR